MKALKIRTKKRYPSNQGWKVVGERRIYFRSLWEVTYANYLQSLKGMKIISEWEYEPKTFWFLEIKRGCRSYKPDFRITNLDGSHYWVEVKGFMDSKSKTKIKRMSKYYPDEKLVIVDKTWFVKNR